ncbi:hypothetical protein EJ077_24915 [Mesorhizobium sp. M8A.F.Ca.ET.057.01.1.1]|nr:hypothetical protein EJ077_24915 [Mesorhizobium sp. M8A.F.Ca.ET.057.01.1.1]
MSFRCLPLCFRLRTQKGRDALQTARQVSLVVEAELVNMQTILDGLSKSAPLATGNLKAHDILTRENWSGADLGDLILSVMGPKQPKDRTSPLYLECCVTDVKCAA